MSGPRVLYCVGATKAGTSWFYRALHAHPDCALSTVKEPHYWDTFGEPARKRQLEAFRKRLEGFRAVRDGAVISGDRAWQVTNMERRIPDLESLIQVIEGDRAGDAGYLDWMTARAGEARLIADMTPGYATLPVETLARMAASAPDAIFVYLIRDPVARLWSHVRMQADRQKQPEQTLVEKANNTLWRILNRGQETHVLARGDYPGTVARLQAAVPADRLRVEYCERLFTLDGQRDMANFLGIGYHPADGTLKAHEGPKARMRKDLAADAARFLADHYSWARRVMGPLPQQWQDSLARAS